MNGSDVVAWTEDQAIEDGCSGTYLGAPVRDDFFPGVATIYFDMYLTALFESESVPVEDPAYLAKRPNGERRI